MRDPGNEVAASKPLNVRLKAEKKIPQSKCRILHALHKLRKKRARKTSVAQTDYSNVPFTLSRAQVSLVTSYESCLACQHLIQIGLITNCVRN